MNYCHKINSVQMHLVVFLFGMIALVLKTYIYHLSDLMYTKVNISHFLIWNEGIHCHWLYVDLRMCILLFYTCDNINHCIHLNNKIIVATNEGYLSAKNCCHGNVSTKETVKSYDLVWYLYSREWHSDPGLDSFYDNLLLFNKSQ